LKISLINPNRTKAKNIPLGREISQLK